jgi:hypothetical protein
LARKKIGAYPASREAVQKILNRTREIMLTGLEFLQASRCVR